MIRRNFYLTQEQNDALEGMDELNVSEHLRRAIDEYIAKAKKERVSSSRSKK